MSNPVQASDLLKYDGVLGIGRGVRIRADQVTEEKVITVYVRKKAPEPVEPIPATAVAADGEDVIVLPTDVVELPPAFAAEAAQDGEYPEAGRAGDTVLAAGVPPGTLGCLARRRSDGARVLVSCYHVLVDPGGQFEPGPVPERPRVLMDVMLPNGAYRPEVPVGFVITAAKTDYPSTIDVAVARITREPKHGGPVRLLRSGKPHPREFLPLNQALNCRVIKSGAATKITCGVVTSVVTEGQTPDGFPLRHTLVITNKATSQTCELCDKSHPVTPISRGGDSGALFVTDEADPRAVGLLWGGDGHRIAYATPWEIIERTTALDVTIRE